MSVPKLRFKEFDGAWSETLFQDLFIFKNGVNASKEQYGSGIKFINVLDIINNPNGITYDSIIGSVNITSKEIDKNLVKYGDVLFQRSSETREEVGQSNVYLGKDPVVFGGFVIRGSAQKEYDPIFMNGLLKTDSLRDQITQLSGGSTRFNIGQDSLNKVSAYLPLKEEQTKIASFLSAVDEKISQLTQKHELLSQYKQGMMQKLFSQQIRFKADDGNEFGEWDKVKLGSLLIKHDEKTEFNNQYPVLTSSRHGIYFQKDYFAGQDVASADTTGYNVVPYDYFTYRHMSDDLVFKFNINTICPKGIVSTLYPVFTVKVDQLNKYFLQTILNEGQEFKNFAIMQKQGGSRTYMYFSKLSELFLTLPCLEEQTKIANFLSSIDQKIEVVAQQIEQSKLWKKGLLQQMFV